MMYPPGPRVSQWPLTFLVAAFCCRGLSAESVASLENARMAAYAAIVADKDRAANLVKRRARGEAEAEALLSDCEKAIARGDYSHAWQQMLLSDVGIELFKLCEGMSVGEECPQRIQKSNE